MQSSAGPSKKLRIAVDLDDVVLDFMPSVMAAFKREYGIEIPYDGRPWGPIAVEFGKHPMFKESGYKDWWAWLKDREWLWANFPAINGAIGGIQRLRAAGHYVECVTSKPEWAEHNVWKWLGKWRPAFHRVTIVTNGQRKVEFTDADVIIDDKLNTCLDFCREGRAAVWFDRARVVRPMVGFLGTLKTAHQWEDVMDCIKELSA